MTAQTQEAPRENSAGRPDGQQVRRRAGRTQTAAGQGIKNMKIDAHINRPDTEKHAAEILSSLCKTINREHKQKYKIKQDSREWYELSNGTRTAAIGDYKYIATYLLESLVCNIARDQRGIM